MSENEPEPTTVVVVTLEASGEVTKAPQPEAPALEPEEAEE